MLRWRPFWWLFLALTLGIGVCGMLAYRAIDQAEQLNPYAGYQFAIGAACVPVGAWIVWRRPDHRVGKLLWISGATVWMTFAGSIGLAWLFQHAHWPEWVLRAILHASSPGWLVTRGCLLVLVPLAFPDSMPIRRWGRILWRLGVVTIVVTAAAHSRVYTFEHFQGQPPSRFERYAADAELWGQRAIWVLAVLASIEMLVCTLKAPNAQRRSYWPLAALVALALVPSAFQVAMQAFDLQLSWWDDRFELWSDVALPIVLAAGVLRRGWFDIRVVLRRATLYVLLAIAAATVYALIVNVFSVFVASTTTLSVVTATGIIAVGSVPLYGWLDRVIGRMLFGTRDLPYETVAALGQRLEQSPQGDDALQQVVAIVAHQLRLPFVAIDLELDSGPTRVAVVGPDAEGAERFRMTYQGEELGALVAAPRTLAEPFVDSERRLLEDLARQAGVVALAARSVEELRRSKMAVVAAREEERRRLRADLHDGLGPTLASVALGLGVAAERLDGEPDLRQLLRDLDGELQHAIDEIRRVVHELRPPALDELGLVGAIDQHAQRVSNRAAGTFEVVVRAPDTLPPLGAAVEVAAYRVALEAITNVIRHAGATRCEITIRCDTEFTMTVVDNGRGMSGVTTNGIGLRSIRSRVADVGGKVLVSSNPAQGTRVDVQLPLQVTA